MDLSLKKCLPLTSSLYNDMMSRLPMAEVKFTSCNLRIKSFVQAILSSILIVPYPIIVAVNNMKNYNSEKSNPLDVLISIVISPIFAIIMAIQGLAGAFIHPGINYKNS